MTEYFGQFFCESNDRYSVVIEDNGRVAYAYLLWDEEIIGDVWLYNQAATPLIFDTTNEIPFLNSADFVRKNIAPITADGEVQIIWFLTQGDMADATIYVRDELVAGIKNGLNPGWSAMVNMDGPLAKVLKR